MVNNLGERALQRISNSILLHISIEEWPSDIPLLPNYQLVKTGSGPFQPYWLVDLRPTETIEVIVGWFSISLSLDETLTHYQAAMEKCGWIKNGGYKMDVSASLKFYRPQTHHNVELSFEWRATKNETAVMIRRVVKHPYAPPAEEEEAVEASVEPALEEVTK